MAALAFFAYFFLGIGPGIVFFLIVLAPKSFLTLLAFTSTFVWLLTLLIISAIFKGFLPIAHTSSSYGGMLVGAVVMQEMARVGVWKAHEATAKVLEIHSRQFGLRFDLIDQLYMALGWGYGHGAAHVIFFVLSFLPITIGEGTWYYEQCPSMSIFLAGSLYALAFGMLLPSLMVLAFDGYKERNWLHVAYPPLMHLTAALLTLINFNRNGCNTAMPILLALGAANVAYAAHVCWRKGPHKQAPHPGAEANTEPLTLPAEGDDTNSNAQMLNPGTDSHEPNATAAAARRRAHRNNRPDGPLIGDDW